MRYEEIYECIKNPLDKKENIDKLLEAYADDTNYYKSLIKVNSKNKDMVYYKQDTSNLHAYLFNTWKKEMLSITKEQYEQAIKKGIYQKDVFILLDLLRKTPDVLTEKEAKIILNDYYENEELNAAIDKYRWDTIGAYSNWTHISSYHVRAKKIWVPTTEHRLYINASQKDIQVLSKLFIDKCTEKNLPYYFKIAEHNRRDDNIVIYSDTKNLTNFLHVLQEIEKEHPDIIKRCGEPPVLTGVLNNWIGYGSEPLTVQEQTSFNSVRSNIIASAIETEMKKWYKKHINDTVSYQGETMDFYQYFGKKVVERELATSKQILERNPNSKLSSYSMEEINNPNFAKAIEKYVSANIKPIIQEYLNENQTIKGIPFTINGKERKISASSIIATIKANINIINKNDPEFTKRIKLRIEEKSKDKGIDIKKYCFDIKNVKLLLKADQEEAKSIIQKQSEKTNKQALSNDSSIKTPRQTIQYVYKQMTDEEILESRRKIGRYVQLKEKTTYQKIETPIYVYKPLTAEEILESQRKLAECPPVKVKIKR